MPRLRAFLFASSVAASAFAGGLGPVSVDAPGDQQLLSAAAAASPRPLGCRPAVGQVARSAWERARRPAERAYCDALAKGYALLVSDPSRALDAARRAEKAIPGRAATKVLEGRAFVAEDRPREAFAAFSAAEKRDRRSLEAPAALHDMAISALLDGHRARALSAYRQLVPRVGLLPDVHERQRVLVEAALAVMGEGEKSLDEAIGYLTEARRQRGAPGLGGVVLGALALALDRQGHRQEAGGVVAEAGAPLGPVTLASAKDATRTIAAPPGELHAVAAILIERTHPEMARAEWNDFLESESGKNGPFAAHAKQKLAAVGAGRKGGAGR
jgi:tetratricopeptide (TPR) repeat protein